MRSAGRIKTVVDSRPSRARELPTTTEFKPLSVVRPTVSERETVTEVVADVAVAVDVPTTAGEDLPGAVADVLDEREPVRHVGDLEVGDVDSGDGTLRVTVETRLTLHFPPDEGVDAGTARERLAAVDSVATVRWFEAVAGPYEVERW